MTRVSQYVGAGFRLRQGYGGQVSRPASKRQKHGPAKAGPYVLLLAFVAGCAEKPPDNVLRASVLAEPTA